MVLEVDDYPVKVKVEIPDESQFRQIMTVLDRMYARHDGYVLTARSRRVFRAVGADAMRPVSGQEAAAIHQLGNRGLIFLVPEQVTLRSGAVRAHVNLLLPTESGFEVVEAFRELTGRPMWDQGGVDGSEQKAG
ncbi:hypothetical protein ACWEFJ_01325 [Actinosynnema sp. NPDC004786]